jgi:Tfp pilus assembly protein PilX
MTDPRPRPSRQPRRTRRPPGGTRGERGSAFTVALLVMLVLTVSGLALTLMTQTEVRIGVNERTTNRSLYASDSGVEVATARELFIGPETQSHTFFLNTTTQDNPSSTAATTFSDQITVTPLIPIGMQYCNLCQVNKGLSQNYSYLTYAVNSTAARIGVDGTFSQTFSGKLLGSTIGMQPQPNGNAANPLQAQIPVQF